MINITRNSSYTDKLRAYQVVVDGNSIGEINDGDTKSFDVKPGVHTLRMKIDWGGSNEVEFKLSRNETINFRCASSMTGLRGWFGVVYVLFLPNRYVELERTN